MGKLIDLTHSNSEVDEGQIVALRQAELLIRSIVTLSPQTLLHTSVDHVGFELAHVLLVLIMCLLHERCHQVEHSAAPGQVFLLRLLDDVGASDVPAENVGFFELLLGLVSLLAAFVNHLAESCE